MQHIALSRFRRFFPKANVRVVERRHDTTLADIREGTLDFAVMPSSTLPDGLVAEVILRDQNVVIGRCGRPLREVSSLRELLEASWVVTRRQGEQAAEFEANFLLQSLPAPKVEVHCESVVGVLSLIVNSHLLGYLPRRWVTAGIGRRREHSPMFKRELVSRSLVPGASVAAVALEAGINSNLLFAWRRMRLSTQERPLKPVPSQPSPMLLPVTVEAAALAACPSPTAAAPRQPAGTIEIDVGGARVRLRGAVDEVSVRHVLQTLKALA